MRLLMAVLVSMPFLTGCGAKERAAIPEPMVVRVTPPESLVREQPRPELPRFEALPPGPAIPRDIVLRRDRAAGTLIANQDAAIGIYEANTRALRRFFEFDRAKPPAAAPPDGTSPPAPPSAAPAAQPRAPP